MGRSDERESGDATEPSDASVDVGSAFDAVRALLEDARSEAERLVDQAERDARARSQEAELLVAKARRLLAVAEDKAAAIIAVARSDAAAIVAAGEADGIGAPGPAAGRSDATSPQPPDASDDADRSTPAADGPGPRSPASSGPDAKVSLSEPSSLDRVLAAAVARAVDRALDER